MTTPQEVTDWLVDDLKHGGNIRSDLGSEEEQRQLGASLRLRQDEPLLILPDGTAVNGNRRLAAARLAGIKRLKCIVIDAGTSPAEYRQIQWRCAVHRKDISAYDKAVTIRDTKADFPALTNRQLADEVLNIDPALLTKNLTLFDCIAEVQEAAKAGLIGLTDWYAISKAPDQGKALALALNGSTRDAIEQESRRQRNGNGRAATVKASSIPLILESGIAVTFKGEGLTLAQAFDALTAIKQELKEAIDFDHDARTFAVLMKKRARELAKRR
jgi:ParB-like chromosome segregation protein Spo0J